MANQMLSVVGSIQPDPFSPHHVPIISSPTQSEQDEEVAVLNELEVGAERAAVDSDDEDVFAHLGKLADETREAELRAREEVEAAAQKEKPKKKKRKKAENDDTSERKKEKKLKRKKT
jgi:DNA-directed RNA polymerase I subunit RPA43